MKMKNKAQAFSRAKATKCSIEYLNGDWILTAPPGKTLRDETHYSAMSYGDGFSMAEIWDGFCDDMSRLNDCDCGCGAE
jgi:hypothetical protein